MKTLSKAAEIPPKKLQLPEYLEAPRARSLAQTN